MPTSRPRPTPTHNATETTANAAPPANEAPQTTGICIAWTTLPSQADAERIAEGAVAEGLAACAQISAPITSFYKWHGEFCRETEWRVTFKLAASKTALLETWLHANHPYETPQWLAIEPSLISPNYRDWILS